MHSIRDLCREAANPETNPDALARLVALTGGHVTRSHRVRLFAALLSNPALSLATASQLIESAPKRIDRRPAYRVKQGPRWSGAELYLAYYRGKITTRQYDVARKYKYNHAELPAPIISALRANPAWLLARIVDPLLNNVAREAVRRLAYSDPWPGWARLWWDSTDVPDE